MKGGVKEIIVGVRKESQKTFYVIRKLKFWEKEEKTKNKGEEPRGEDFL